MAPPPKDRPPRKSAKTDTPPPATGTLFQHPFRYNIEAEEAVLGSLMIDPSKVALLAPLLQVDDFYREKHQWLYEAILRLNERRAPIDPLTLADEVDLAGHLADIGGPAAISDLFQRVPTAIHVEYYAAIVERNGVLRRLVAAAEKIAKMAYEMDDTESVAGIIKKAEDEFLGVNTSFRKSGLRPIGVALSEHYDSIEAVLAGDEVRGIATGFRDLDQLLGGLQPGNLVVLGARPSIGKTALTLNMADNMATAGLRVAYFSMEMGIDEVCARLLSSRTNIDSQRFRTGPLSDDDLLLITEAVESLSKTPLMVDDSSSLTVGEMRSKLRRAIAEGGVDVAIVDYVQLMNSGRSSGGELENRQQEIAMISRGLKELGRELGIPIIAICQLSRKVEERQDKRPLLSDLKESGSLEQDADIVLFIYREEVYKKNKTERPGIAEIITAKHRNGPTGTIELRFQKANARFSNLEMPTYNDGESQYGLPPVPADPSLDDIVF